MRLHSLLSATAFAVKAKAVRSPRLPARSDLHTVLPMKEGVFALRRLPAFAVALSLAACSAVPVDSPTTRASTSAVDFPVLEALPLAGTPVPNSRLPSNSELARDFTELSFNLESGRTLGWFSRFEGPITISMHGPAPSGAAQELSRLVGRMRTEAGLNITAVNGAGASPQNSIFVEFVPKRAMNSAVPNAACFVVPNVVSWADYKDNRRNAKVDWAAVKQRTHATVFIPAEAAPQEVRDCLHEEIAQGLGPLNDLFRLPDSVFNDSNFHAVLTRFDMMILKATYAPELRSGMSQPEAFAALAHALPRINPAGGAVGAAPRAGETPKAFVASLQRAIGAGSLGSRKAAAREAIAIAGSQGWTDTRMAFAWFALGRLSINDEPAVAVQAFSNAGNIYRRLPGAGIQAAHVDMQLAGFALSTGQAQDAIALVNRSLGAALDGQNAALLATLYMIRAESYDQLGNQGAAQQARLDSQNWARYGFGSDAAMRQRAAEVASLARAGSRLN